MAVRVRLCIYVCARVRACVRVHKHEHVCAYLHIHLHNYAHVCVRVACWQYLQRCQLQGLDTHKSAQAPWQFCNTTPSSTPVVQLHARGHLLGDEVSVRAQAL
jgi:hypothetical protein